MPGAALYVAAARVAAAAGVQEHESIRRSFQLTRAERREVLADNFSGAVHLKGYDGTEPRATIPKRLRADRAERAAETRSEARGRPERDRVRMFVDVRTAGGDPELRFKSLNGIFKSETEAIDP